MRRSLPWTRITTAPLSPDEISNSSVALKSLDKNKDGKITADEVRPAFDGRGGRGGRGGREGGEESSGPNANELVKTLLEFDRDGDGKLQKSEVPERMQGLFARGDLDKDGVLSGDEIRTLAQSQTAGTNGPGGEGRGEREGPRWTGGTWWTTRWNDAHGPRS